MRAFPLITNFNEKNAYSKSQISNIVLVEYFILLGKKKTFYVGYQLVNSYTKIK